MTGSAKKRIEVRYFASLRDHAGKESELIETPFATYGDLYRHLADQYRFPLPLEMVQLAVNDEFARFERPLEDGARVVFIPPVAGG